MQIDWWTFAFQTVNFLVLVWLLRRFLYRPVKEVIEKRRQLAGQAFADADAQKSQAEAARRRFEADRDRLAQERRDLLKKIQGDLNNERRKVLDDARQEAEKLLGVARESLAKERESALTELREQVAALAVELASDLLRQAGSGALDGVFLEQFARLLKDMPEEEREHLQKDLATDGARLTVVTPTAPTPEEQDRWTDWLSANLGQRDKTDFVTDPEILGGAEIRFPHAVLKLTWADQLRKAEEKLRSDDTPT